MRPVQAPRVVAILVAVATGCGVRAPTPVDVPALLARRGPVEARRDLEIRILAEPRDVQARLALAALADQLGYPSDAIEQLEAVERLGGPVGTRWHPEDRARFAKLLVARGRARLIREAASALGDLTRAQKLGATIEAGEFARGRAAVALTKLRHVDAKERAAGRAILVELGARDPAWVGAGARASAAEHGAFGAWLWARGAKREAYEQLAAWRAGTAEPREAGLAALFDQANAWWSPDAAVAALRVPAPPPSPSPSPNPSPSPGTDAPIVVPTPDVALLDPRALAAATYANARVVAIITAGRAGAMGDPLRLTGDDLVAAHGPGFIELVGVANAFRRDPAIAERLARELIGRSVDSALAGAAIGAVFDALGDPARARTAWLAASTESDESAIVAGYAAAAARAGDGDAALVVATGAAAASGDPAWTWLDIGRALLRGHRPTDAITTMRTAMDLAGANALAATLDLAIEASRQVGREAQADALAARRAVLSPAPTGHAAQRVELAELGQRAPNASVLAATWVMTRADLSDVELRAALYAALERDDPRRATLELELIGLAADADSDRGLAAALALQQQHD